MHQEGEQSRAGLSEEELQVKEAFELLIAFNPNQTDRVSESPRNHWIYKKYPKPHHYAIRVLQSKADMILLGLRSQSYETWKLAFSNLENHYMEDQKIQFLLEAYYTQRFDAHYSADPDNYLRILKFAFGYARNQILNPESIASLLQVYAEYQALPEDLKKHLEPSLIVDSIKNAFSFSHQSSDPKAFL